MEDDWLALPAPLPGEEQGSAEKNPDRPEQLPVPVVEKKLPLLAQKRGSFPDLWRKLKPLQRLYLDQLVKAGFNKSRALRACTLNGHKIYRQKPLRWKNDPTYAKVFEQIQNAVLGEATNPATMLLQADEILNRAMRGTRRYGKDGNFVGREVQLETALRANEQKMKATGMLRADERSTRVTVRLVNLAGLDGQKVIDGQAVEVVTE